MFGIRPSPRGKQFSAGMQFSFVVSTVRIMKLQLKDKLVVVTGAGKGIGEAISVPLSQEGAVPIIVGHDDIASKTAITGQGGTSGYASFKGALFALARKWDPQLLPYSIRVNAVVPAEVMTPLYQQWLSSFPNPQQKLDEIISKIPLGKRMRLREEIVAMVVFLISERAGHITGQHLFVGGGYAHLDRALT